MAENMTLVEHLKQVYAKMTPGEHEYDPETGRITAPVRGVSKCTGTIAVIHGGLRTGAEADAEGRGFVELHNHFPALVSMLEEARESLREAKAWMPGRATPDFRGAKMGTASEAHLLVADALARLDAPFSPGGAS